MNILIIEDELPAARRLKSILNSIDPEMAVLEVKESISSSVKWLKENGEPELIFMDIQLSDGLSFEIFNQVEIKCPIIFTTAFDEYAIQAFKVNSIDYLLKPIETEHLKKSLDKLKFLKEEYSHSLSSAELKKLFDSIKHQKKVYKSRFLVKSGKAFVAINASECSFFYVDNKNTYAVQFSGKKHLLDYALEELEENLDEELFFRANRQFILNKESITSIHTNFSGKLKVIVKPPIGEGVIISRAKAPEFKEWMES